MPGVSLAGALRISASRPDASRSPVACGKLLQILLTPQATEVTMGQVALTEHAFGSPDTTYVAAREGTLWVSHWQSTYLPVPGVCRRASTEQGFESLLRMTTGPRRS